MTAPKLLIVTTTGETLATILTRQPAFLSQLMDVELATSPGPDHEDIRLREKVPLHSVPMARGITPFRDLMSLIRMILLLCQVRPDIVHSYTPKAGLITMLASWFCRVPVRIHTFTGLIFPTQKGWKQKLLIWADRLVCACATRVVPEGQGVRRDLERWRITSKPLEVIGHGNIAGVDTSHFSIDAPGVQLEARKLARTLKLPSNAFVYCFVGRLNRDKGIAELLESFKQLPETAHLILVGSLDETAPIGVLQQAFIEEHPRVHALGFVRDVRPAMYLCDVFILPSYREGFPNAVLQAGAMQRPVVATDINGSNEIVVPGVTGWLVPPRQTASLRKAMEAAMHSPRTLLDDMGVRARTVVAQHFEQRQHWQRMADFYRHELPAASSAPVTVAGTQDRP